MLTLSLKKLYKKKKEHVNLSLVLNIYNQFIVVMLQTKKI